MAKQQSVSGEIFKAAFGRALKSRWVNRGFKSASAFAEAVKNETGLELSGSTATKIANGAQMATVEQYVAMTLVLGTDLRQIDPMLIDAVNEAGGRLGDYLRSRTVTQEIERRRYFYDYIIRTDGDDLSRMSRKNMDAFIAAVDSGKYNTVDKMDDLLAADDASKWAELIGNKLAAGDEITAAESDILDKYDDGDLTNRGNWERAYQQRVVEMLRNNPNIEINENNDATEGGE